MDNLVQRKQLIRYLPDFMKQFGEFQEIMKVEDLQFDQIDLYLQSVLNNAFILDADEYGIKKYETLLGIIPSIEDTLESRRSRVLLRWNNKTPHTLQGLILKLNTLCGVNNYDITGNQEDYYLHFDTHLSLFGQVNELKYCLENILPENMYYTSSNMIECKSGGDVLIGTGLSTSSLVQLSNDFSDILKTDGDVLIGTGTVQVSFYEIK